MKHEAQKRNWKSFYVVGDSAVMDRLKEGFKTLPVIKSIPKNIRIEAGKEHVYKLV
ncbi:hypothetical protein J2S00_002484 [Caldalkalibacillus uzonensis]|uniref:Uncharacterized protein n=1 Tax=Caldalkalibacillus uzonensis TaxID=353224 RepID=A0ABU0CUW6_9BACI|nr:hypothetical protein [Caldalkalibacillus uzonensis]